MILRTETNKIKAMITRTITKPHYIPDDVFEGIITRLRENLTSINATYEELVSGKHEGEMSYNIISDIICAYYNTTIDEVRESKMSRKPGIRIVRQLLCYFPIKYLWDNKAIPLMTKEKITHKVNYHHATGLHSYNRIRNLLDCNDFEYAPIIRELDSEIRKAIGINA